eukprot:5105891-Alexandrium_andersonii.AAC.1
MAPDPPSSAAEAETMPAGRQPAPDKFVLVVSSGEPRLRLSSDEPEHYPVVELVPYGPIAEAARLARDAAATVTGAPPVGSGRGAAAPAAFPGGPGSPPGSSDSLDRFSSYGARLQGRLAESSPTALRLGSRPTRVTRRRPWQRRARVMRRRPPPSSVT